MVAPKLQPPLLALETVVGAGLAGCPLFTRRPPVRSASCRYPQPEGSGWVVVERLYVGVGAGVGVEAVAVAVDVGEVKPEELYESASLQPMHSINDARGNAKKNNLRMKLPFPSQKKKIYWKNLRHPRRFFQVLIVAAMYK